MENSNKIVIVGSSGAVQTRGLVKEVLLHKIEKTEDSFRNEASSFVITPRHETLLEPLWIDPKIKMFNSHKHNQTCAKNRQKRRKRSKSKK